VKDTSRVIEQASKAVAAVFSGFGGFLLNVQPPEGVVKSFTIGFASAVSALLFLLISVVSQRYAARRYKTIFLFLCVALILVVIVAGLRYQNMYQRMTLDIPAASGHEKIIIGTELTTAASDAQKKNGEPLPQLLLDFGGKNQRERVWPRPSISAATLALNNAFTLLSVSLAAAVFCIVDFLVPRKQKAQ
jgi:energy-coupling factor transporter transmembrane protein EcfT